MKARIAAILCPALLVAVFANAMNPAVSSENPDTGSGLESRPAWTTSRITGSPEPPHPYKTEPTFPKLRWTSPIELVALPGSSRLVLAEHAGRIYSFPNHPDADRADLFADLKTWIPEIREVYSVAFHPHFATNRHVFLWCILQPELPDGTRISRFTVTTTDPPRVDLATEHIAFTWKSGGHNGGSMRFGLDGMLYIATGDGVGPDPPDPHGTGQDISDVLSSILRIDVDRVDPGKSYAIPPDNPFVATPGARPEVWAYGFRNPWRLSVDSKTGDVWTADVGWELWEMVYRVVRGGNYGWSIMEGSRQVIKPDGRRGPTPILPPTFEHPHSEAASITGGFVYHGKRLPALTGSYIYGDYETGKIWALRHDGARVTSHQELVDTPFKIVSFGEDHGGELHVIDFNGGLHQLVPNRSADQPSRFPRTLRDTGLFSDVPHLQPAPGVIPYSVNAEHWVDGAISRRFVAIPDTASIETTSSPWKYPPETVFVRNLSLPVGPAGAKSNERHIETQILHFNGEVWNGYSYQWRDDQSDAFLVDKDGAEQTLTVWRDSAEQLQTWRFHSRAECLRCHNPWCGTVLGFNPAQLNRPLPSGQPTPTPPGQLQALAAMRVLDRAVEIAPGATMADPYDTRADLNDRARSWLHVNCSHCHRQHAGGSVLSYMNHDWPLARLNLVGASPMQGDFGIPGAAVIAPGDPHRSILLYRISKLGRGHMPYLGARTIDVRGIGVIRDWIQQMPAVGDPTANLAMTSERNDQASAAARLLQPLPEAERAQIIDRLLQTIPGAMVLLQTLDDARIPGAIRDAVIARTATAPHRQILDLFERFIPEEKRRQTLGLDIKSESILSLRGDIARGRRLFFEEASIQCGTCHRIGREGRAVGPDLDQIGSKYSRQQILESILEPSKTIAPEFATYLVELRDGEVHSGFITGRSEESLVLKDSAGSETRLSSGNVARIEPQRLSLMPEGLLQGLTAQEAADLIEFLASLK